MHKHLTAFFFFLAALVSVPATLFAQKPAWQPAPGHITLQLWPHPQSDLTSGMGPEIDATTAKDGLTAGKPVMRLTNVSSPTITLYSATGKNSGAAVIVFPGGSYRFLPSIWKARKFVTG